MEINMTEGRTLVVVVGCSGAGKSTLARALGDRLAAGGIRAVAVDLDLIVEMSCGHEAFPVTHEAWSGARRAAAGLVDGFFEAGVELVVIEGDVWSSYIVGGDSRVWYEAWPDFVEHVRSDPEMFLLAVRVSYEEALRRVQGDEGRGLSRNPDWLREDHARFERDLGSLNGWRVLESDGGKAGELVDEVIGSLVEAGLVRVTP